MPRAHLSLRVANRPDHPSNDGAKLRPRFEPRFQISRTLSIMLCSTLSRSLAIRRRRLHFDAVCRRGFQAATKKAILAG
jgi:hypothetical protein